jgi:hypothetical protein
MAELVYTVHDSAVNDVVKQATVDGEAATVTLKRIVTELVPDDGISGTIKLVLPVANGEVYEKGDKVHVIIEKVA